MQELFAAIRESASKVIWSKGVALSRQNFVSGESQTSEEIILRVTVPNRSVASKVTLWPKEEDWNCDCSSSEDPCEHVTAAAIAVKQARENGQALPAAGNSIAKIGYRFRSTEKGLDFYRSVEEPGKPEVKLTAALSALKSGRISGPEVAPTKEDLAFEVALGHQKDGIFPQNKWRDIRKFIAECSDVKIDGEEITFSKKRTGIVAVVEDESGGVILRGIQDPEISKVYSNGIARCGNELKLVTDGGLTPSELELLRNGTFYGLNQLSHLVSEILPAIKKKIVITITAKNLPKNSDAEPRVVVATIASDRQLHVIQKICYGDPAIAEIRENQLVMLSDGCDIPVRNQFLEEKLMSQASSKLELGGSANRTFDGEMAVDFTDRLKSWRGEISGDGYEKFTRMEELTPGFSVNPDGFELRFESKSGDGSSSSAQASAVVDAWERGESMVPLLDGGWAPIPVDWFGKYGERIRNLLAAREAMGKFSNALAPDLIEICQDLNEPIPVEWKGISEVIENFSGVEKYSIPSDLSVELRDYQKTGVRWLNFLSENKLGGILADDMGLGKTLQAISVIKGRTLVVAPTSVIQNWQNEVKKFRSHLSTCLYHGPKRVFDKDVNIVITTYAILRLETETFQSEEWDCLILDEAQNIKNSDSNAAKAAFSLSANFKLSLSGTPIENSLDELWSQLNFTNPGLLGSKKNFQETYSKKIQTGDQTAIDMLRARIKPFILRRLKKDVAKELPPKTTTVIRCELSESERDVYESLLLAARKDIAELVNEGGSVFKALEMLLRLRQAACHTGLVPGESAESSSKLKLVRENLEKTLAAGHKTLIFSQWTSFLDKVGAELDDAGIKFLRLDGSTKNRQEIVDRFQETDDYGVLIISIKAGGTGITLTAADHVMILDPWWNPAVEDQAADRAHRIGQTKPVLIQKIVAKDTVEERILELQERKKQLADSVLAGSSAAPTITKEDLLSLI